MDDSNTTAGANRATRRSSTTPSSANDTTSPIGAESATVGTRGTGSLTSPGSAAGWRSEADGDQGRGLMGRVRERATAQLTTQKDRATDGLGSVAQAVRQSTQHLRDQRHDGVARFVEQAADQLDRLSKSLKHKDVSELFNDAQRLARRQPALFIGGAFALGLLGARFLKSSPRSRRGAYDTGRDFDYTAGESGRSQDRGRSYDQTPATLSGTARDLPGTESY